MLTVSNITKRFLGADEDILTDISFTVNGGERVGLIGPNGSGKSTLLRIIAGLEQADKGSIMFTPSNLRVGYLAQGMIAPDDAVVADVLYPHGDLLAQAEAEVERLAEAMGSGDTSEATLNAYSDTLERLLMLSEASERGDGERMLAELGLAAVPLDARVGSLSGGQKTRLMLAALLLDHPRLLLLDEPTNHLDIHALTWLEDWLLTFSGGLLIVSHDRAFVDRVVNRTVALDPKTHKARVFDGGYSAYMETIENERHKQWMLWRDEQVEIERLRRDFERMKQKALGTELTTVNDFWRGRSKMVAKKAMAKKNRYLKYIESEDRVEKPARTRTMKLDFGDVRQTGRAVLRLEELSIGYDRAVPLLENLTVDLSSGERVAIMGPNGHGKSTLLKTILGTVPPLSGRVVLSPTVKIGYLAQEQEILDPDSTALETLLKASEERAEGMMNHTEARTFLHLFLFAGDDVFKPVRTLSYGERARLMLAVLVAGGASLLLLDEPLNHLDVSAREQFEEALASFDGSVLAVVHDRYFVDRFATTVWHVADGEFQKEYRLVDERV